MPDLFLTRLFALERVANASAPVLKKLSARHPKSLLSIQPSPRVKIREREHGRSDLSVEWELT